MSDKYPSDGMVAGSSPGGGGSHSGSEPEDEAGPPAPTRYVYDLLSVE